MVKETVEELLKEHMIKTIENTRKVNKELDLLIDEIKGEKKKKENKTVLDLFVKYLKSSTKSMEDARKKLKKNILNFFNMKEIYIKRLLRHTKEGQGFYCSQAFIINGGLDKRILDKRVLAPLLRNNKPLFFLERSEVAIPTGVYPLAADFTGKHQCVKILNVPNRFNIEIHAGNYLRNTMGCPLLGQNYDENRQYSNQDIIINESQDSCDWFRDDFLLNDEQNKKTKKVDQDEVIGHINITIA